MCVHMCGRNRWRRDMCDHVSVEAKCVPVQGPQFSCKVSYRCEVSFYDITFLFTSTIAWPVSSVGRASC